MNYIRLSRGLGLICVIWRINLYLLEGQFNIPAVQACTGEAHLRAAN